MTKGTVLACPWPRPDKEREFSQATTSALAAWKRGEATPEQQQRAFKAVMVLCNPTDIAPHGATERHSGLIDGARWVGNAIGKLAGAGVRITDGDDDERSSAS